MALEKAYENKIKKYIKTIGGYCVKYHGNYYSESGTPDILACINGYFIAIEVKAPEGKATELQMEKIKMIRKANGLAYVVYPSGWFKLKEILDNLKNDEFNVLREEVLK